MGVVTGVVLSYEIGTNWAGFSRSVVERARPAVHVRGADRLLPRGRLHRHRAVRRGPRQQGPALLLLLHGRGRHAASAPPGSSPPTAGCRRPPGAVADAQGIYHVVDWWQVDLQPVLPLSPRAHGLRQLRHRLVRGRRRLGLPPVAPAACRGEPRRLLAWRCGWRCPDADADRPRRPARAQHARPPADQARRDGGPVGHDRVARP